MIFKGIVKLSFLILNLKNKYINLINTNNHFLAKSLAQSSNQVIENYVWAVILMVRLWIFKGAVVLILSNPPSKRGACLIHIGFLFLFSV